MAGPISALREPSPLGTQTKGSNSRILSLREGTLINEINAFTKIILGMQTRGSYPRILSLREVTLSRKIDIFATVILET